MHKGRINWVDNDADSVLIIRWVARPNVTIPTNASTFIRLSTDPATIRILSGLRTWKSIRWSCDHSASQGLLLTLTRLSLTRQQQLKKKKEMIQFPWNDKIMVTM